MMFFSSLSVDSVTEMYRLFSPYRAPWTRNSRQSDVLPVPTEPVMSTVLPLGIPPSRMLSRPSMPVTQRSTRTSEASRSLEGIARRTDRPYLNDEGFLAALGRRAQLHLDAVADLAPVALRVLGGDG